MKLTQAGFSLLELLIVLSIISIILAIPIRDFQKKTKNRELHFISQKIVSDLHFLRMQAIASSCDHYIEFIENAYAFIRLDAYDQKEIIYAEKRYPAAIFSNSVKLGFKYNGNTKYAGSLFLENIQGTRYKITLAPVTGKITLKI